MISTIDVIALVASASAGVASLVLWISVRRAMRQLSIARFCRVTPEEPWIPDAAIIAQKPLVYHIAELGRDLYLHPLPMEPHRALMEKFVYFFTAYATALRSIPILVSDELDSPIMMRAAAEKFATVFTANPKMLDAAIRIIEYAFLRSRKTNPNRVTLRQLRKCRLDTIIALWLRARERNVDCIRDFIQALLRQLREGKPRLTSGYGSGKNAEYLSRIKQPSPSLSPFYWPGGLRNARPESGTGSNPDQRGATNGDKRE